MLVPKYGERMKYLVVKSSMKPLRNRSLSLFEYLMKNTQIDWQYYAEKQFLPPIERVLSSLVCLKDWCPSAIPYNYENFKQMNVFLKKKCLKCK